MERRTDLLDEVDVVTSENGYEGEWIDSGGTLQIRVARWPSNIQQYQAFIDESSDKTNVVVSTALNQWVQSVGITARYFRIRTVLANQEFRAVIRRIA